MLAVGITQYGQYCTGSEYVKIIIWLYVSCVGVTVLYFNTCGNGRKYTIEKKEQTHPFTTHQEGRLITLTVQQTPQNQEEEGRVVVRKGHRQTTTEVAPEKRN